MTSLDDLTFLIVDENSHMVSVLKVLLRAFGVRQIEECYESTKACDAFQASRPDIVALSSNLTVPSLELVRRFRDFRNSPDPFVPIILVNSYTDSVRLKRARDAGVTEMVRKPVSASDLFRAVDSIIRHPRPFINVAGYFGPCRRQGEMSYYGPERRQISASRAAQAMAPFAPLPLAARFAKTERRETTSLASFMSPIFPPRSRLEPTPAE